eukprot:TRINITY_DN1646_c1_g1_i1.p1 TRINITY_DN1646_c1_g1~~TRINITY_DN1646_c1_g1_i1.p1  ORF type:complete len:844 (+),score=333.58 TRINITY_DN1646_c1_g1_i1:2169-4700(+)
MGTLTRSEEMQMIRLFIQVEAAHDTVEALGEIGLLHFRDLNPKVNAFQRNFVNEVKRCDEMERKLNFFESAINKAGIDIPKMDYFNDGNNVDKYDNDRIIMDDLEETLEEYEEKVIQMQESQETLERNYNELQEMHFVLEKDSGFFGNSGDINANNNNNNDDFGEKSKLIDNELLGNFTGVGFVTGVIKRSKMPLFERILWRTTRGNLFLRQQEIETWLKDPVSGEYEEKNVFIVFYQGQKAADKINKICSAMNVNLYPCPEDSEEREGMSQQISNRINDLKYILDRTRKTNMEELTEIAKQLSKWKDQVLREKSIYHQMNLFNYDVGRKCLIADAWCPNNPTDMEKIHNALKKANNKSGALAKTVLQIVPTKRTPPTYYKTNEFTESFQLVVDSYGVARYGEMNPAPYTIITFPFLFGVMFGDAGHGFIFLLIALALLIFQNKLKQIKLNEMVEMLFYGRYLFLFMAIFAIFCGLLYNEVFGLALDIFGTRWYWPVDDKGGVIAQFATPGKECASETGEWIPYCNWNGTSPYPFGVDPNWKWALNELDFYNSLKMKMSVLMGVTQMVFGLSLNFFNHIHFGNPIYIFLEWIPQVVFMLSIFGYMDVLIIYKWLVNWWNPPFSFMPSAFSVNGVPRLLNLMIYMVLSFWDLSDDYHIYPGQAAVQIVLLLLAVIAVPIMLFGKPIYLYFKHKNSHHDQDYHPVQEGERSEFDDEDDGEEFEFSEEFIHQVIHTIEYVLGCISNTASYLRLWALSLAHAQLSEVFYQRVLEFLLESENFFMIFIGWSVWAALTIAVLLIMESLSALLHALRLHWVEFQNKFFIGDGYAFNGFDFDRIRREAEEV